MIKLRALTQKKPAAIVQDRGWLVEGVVLTF